MYEVAVMGDLILFTDPFLPCRLSTITFSVGGGLRSVTTAIGFTLCSCTSVVTVKSKHEHRNGQCAWMMSNLKWLEFKLLPRTFPHSTEKLVASTAIKNVEIYYANASHLRLLTKKFVPCPRKKKTESFGYKAKRREFH